MKRFLNKVKKYNCLENTAKISKVKKKIAFKPKKINNNDKVEAKKETKKVKIGLESKGYFCRIFHFKK